MCSLHPRHIREIFADRENGQRGYDATEDIPKEKLKTEDIPKEDLMAEDMPKEELKKSIGDNQTAIDRTETKITMTKEEPVKPQYRQGNGTEGPNEKELDVQINATILLSLACCLCCIINVIFCIALCFRIE
uniref:Uncharacterized protein n=1 Tax=Cacopsylla melanoneura TaxID=428564 RepID=A0A8D9BCA9_9HEMI